MTPETIQDLIEQSTRLIDTAALLPSDFIDRFALLRSAERRTQRLWSEERDAKRKKEQLEKEFAMVNWATQAHLRLRALIGTRLEEYGATLEQSGTTLLLRAKSWDRHKNDLGDYSGVLAKVEPFRFYSKRHRYRSEEEIEGNFLNVTLAGKTSRHTNPNFPKIAASLVDAARENAEFIQHRIEERDKQAHRASTLIEKFGGVVPLREEKNVEYYGGNSARTRGVLHSITTRIEPIGVISSGEIFEAHNKPEQYGVRLSLTAMSEETMKRVLALLAKEVAS